MEENKNKVVDDLKNELISKMPKKDEYIEIKVEDNGTGKIKTTAEEMQKLMEERRKAEYKFIGIRGRGLPKIVAEWTDELVFQDKPTGGLIVTVKKYLKDPRYNSGLPESTPTHLVLNI